MIVRLSKRYFGHTNRIWFSWTSLQNVKHRWSYNSTTFLCQTLRQQKAWMTLQWEVYCKSWDIVARRELTRRPVSFLVDCSRCLITDTHYKRHRGPALYKHGSPFLSSCPVRVNWHLFFFLFIYLFFICPNADLRNGHRHRICATVI